MRYRGRYEPLELLGEGAQGQVWKALDHQHDRIVALKTREDADEAGLAEARVLLELAPHTALPLVRDDFFEDGKHVMVMDFVEGPNLRTILDRRDRAGLPFEEAHGHLDRVAGALEHLHGHSPPVCHRDVKPANIVIGAHGAVLVDLGLADRVPLYGGTRHYLAPELAVGEPATAASDVFALAVTAHVLLTGSYPEPGRTPDLDVVPPEHHAAVLAALDAALSYDPSGRPTARGFVDALRPPPTPTNLPSPLSSFVGRAAELETLGSALWRSRCVTLTGTGGVGKTRLASEVARRRLRQHPGGVWFADLSGVPSAEGVVAAVRSAVGGSGGGDPVDEIIEAVSKGRTLLVVDTCEHVLDGVAGLVERLLERCPDLTVLATSREPVRVSGEHLIVLDPMPETDATTLLLERAGTAGARHALAPDDAVRLVEALDGLPLAIELAAARIGELGLPAVLDGLTDRLATLTSGPRARERHRTIEAAIDWSYRLLERDEQVCLRRLGVFAGGFRADAAAMVTGTEAVAALPRLAASSLVSPASIAADGEARYRLLDTVRAFAVARLSEVAELDEIREKHASWCSRFIEDWEQIRGGAGEQVQALQVAEAEHDNVVEAIRFGGLVGLRTAEIVWAIWRAVGRTREAVEMLRFALANAPDGPGPERASALQKLAASIQEQGDLEGAEAALLEAASLLAPGARPRMVAAIHNTLGTVAAMRGDTVGAIERFEEALGVMPADDAEGRANIEGNLGRAYMLAGRLEEAEEIFRRHESGARARADWQHVVRSHVTLGHLASMQGRTDAAAAHTIEAILLMLDTGLREAMPHALVNLTFFWQACGHLELAARTWGAAEEEMERASFVISPGERAEVDRDLDLLRSRLGPERFEGLVAEGRRWRPEDVLANRPADL